MAKATGLAREQLGALAELNRINLGEHFYLAGGSGVAAHLRHRRSIDLDLFSRRPDADLSRLGAELAELLEDTQVVSATDVTLTIRAGKLAIDIVRYPYAVLEQPVPGPSGFPLAGLLDLAAMKLAAVAKRGIRRDFWDLHQIATASKVGLHEALDAYVNKFGVREADLYPVIRSLTYFDDAEAERAMPRGLTKSHWTRIKKYFLENAPRQLRNQLA